MRTYSGPPSVEVCLPSPLIELRDERLRGIRLLFKRDDLIGEELSGNKWRKLKYVLDDVHRCGARTMLTFGGAYSNHVRAVAVAGSRLGLRTVGVIRGEERPFNELLARSAAHGMHLHYITRTAYRHKDDPGLIVSLRDHFGDFYLIPEGGTTPLSIPGCRELVAEIDEPFDVLCCPVGTGGTLAGLAAGLAPGQRARGYAVLRGMTDLEAAVDGLHRGVLGHPLENWTIDHRFHFGGFARSTPELDAFAADFADRHGIELDHVYVAKMMFGILSGARDGRFAEGATVVAVVTGGPGPVAGRSRSTSIHRS